MKIEWCSEFEGSPDPHWYFTRGHVDKEVFIVKLQKALEENAWGLPFDWQLDPETISVEEVSLEWWHFYPTGLKDPKGCYASVKGAGRGNFPVTVYNVEYEMGNSEDIGLLLHER